MLSQILNLCFQILTVKSNGVFNRMNTSVCSVDYIDLVQGGNADYPIDIHQKEQLHENSVSMMQPQHFSVSFIW